MGRGMVLGWALAVLVLLGSTGCAAAEDPESVVSAAARDYISAISTADQARADDLAGREVDLTVEDAVLHELVGAGAVTSTSVLSVSLHAGSDEGVLWTGDTETAPVAWTVDLDVITSEPDAQREVSVTGWLTPGGQVSVDPLEWALDE